MLNETQADYPQLITGKIALISRGTCTFALKSAIAGKMGAVGAIVFNNAPNATGTVDLYANSSQIYGTVVPTVTISGEDGASFANAIKAGNAPRASLQTYTVLNNVTTNNVLAHSKHGDQNNILQLGAHSDSVEEGPGINDNGSGVSSLIEVAKLLSSYRIHNSVRFSWWSGEEPGQLGAEYFVTTLTEAEKKKIRLYLNFDMMASPNYQFEIFDGDGSSYNITGPPGSGAAEKLFENYFDDRHLNHTPAVFDGRSDYKPFQEAGIAIGGLFAGADENKTREGVEKFGGIEGQPLDPNLHSPADIVSNLNTTAFLINTQGIAHAVATYATSFRSLGTNDTRLETKLETKLEKRKRERKVRRAPEKRKIGSMGLRRKLLPTKIKRSSRVFI
ncbi:hypothetical protein EG328_005969 [Venturia inaequalis]|uniref:Peptide hydrolase n=1 Tax=Venturia inaequalis TaxID=5025 RepID=A0A8H3UKN9_VENIN|nr:hypothetical protein EG328_005969 [Venturia inaequalis]